MTDDPATSTARHPIQPRIHAIILAVESLERSMAFYRDGLGLTTEGVIGTEWTGDDVNAAGAIVTFVLHGGLILGLYPRSELGKDAGIPPGPARSGEFSIGHAVQTRGEVDTVLAAAEAAGATLTGPPRDRPWGVYSGYFRDPDGHLWEVLWNPALPDV